MTWFLIALVGPFLWSLVNHIDKYLLTKYFRSDGIGALLIFSSIVGIFVLPVAYFFEPTVLSLPITTILILLLLGVIIAFTLLLYLYALNIDEASIVAPFYQIIPVFGIILGYLILGEKITTIQIIGCIILILSAILLSLDFNDNKKIRIKFKLAIIIICASILIAITEVVFKYIAIEDSFWISTFWQYTGLTIFGVLLLFVRSYRKQFMQIILDNKRWVFSLNVGSELLTLVGNLAFSFATLLAPLALVLSADSYRPLFVLIIGIFLTIFLPKISQEKITKRYLSQKFISVILMIIGTYLLYIN